MAALFGDYEVARKSGFFDPEYYLATYPDVVERNVDPLVHYLEEGSREGRNPHPDFDSAFYLEQCKERGEAPENPLIHYIRIGAARGFRTRRDADGLALPSLAPADPVAVTGKMPILVAVETLGVAGAPSGGSRLSIGGWALAPAPIVEISATIDGNIVGHANYGLPRPDVAQIYPGHENATRSGFMLTVELPRLASGKLEPMLIVRTADGDIGRRALSVDVPPQEVDAPTIDPLTQSTAEPATSAKSPMQLHIDHAAVDDDGILRVEGWVVCLVQIESVEAFIDDERIGEAEFGRVRGDVEKVWFDYSNSRFSGFLLVSEVSRLGAGKKVVTLRATARTGIAREAAAPVIIPEPATRRSSLERAFHHHCDEIALTTDGAVALKGWAVCASPTASIKVLLDGGAIGEAEAGAERPDVGNMLPTLAHARRSAFMFRGHAGKRLQGEHLITLEVLGEGGELHEIALPVLAVEGARQPDAPAGNTIGDAERKLQLDVPAVIGGAMEMPVRGNLEISRLGAGQSRGGPDRDRGRRHPDRACRLRVAAARHSGGIPRLGERAGERLSLSRAAPDPADGLTYGVRQLARPKRRDGQRRVPHRGRGAVRADRAVVAETQDESGRDRSRSAHTRQPQLATAVLRCVADACRPGILAQGPRDARLAGGTDLSELAADRGASKRWRQPGRIRGSAA